MTKTRKKSASHSSDAIPLPRWRELLAWALAENAHDAPFIPQGSHGVDPSYGPQNRLEEFEDMLLRSLVAAETGDSIQAVISRSGRTLEEILRLSTPQQVKSARAYARLLAKEESGNWEPPRLYSIDQPTRIYAKKFNTVRRDQQTAREACSGRKVRDGRRQQTDAYRARRTELWTKFGPWMDAFFLRPGNQQHSLTRAREFCAQHFGVDHSTVKRRTKGYRRPV